jgi:eukaryotic-like serine/threonine-protein kinase
VNHPERLGKYRITGVLGEGAMGVVYRGFDPDIRRLVALKTIRRQQPGDAGGSVAESAARFRNEAQAAGRLQHPGIVSVYDFGDDGRIAYIAMEYVEGRTLAQHLANRQRLADADIASLVAQLLDALQHAHEHGVWHRDVKPSNVILTPQGRAKIADFGIARTENSGLTMAHSVLGTPTYMAPEQFMGKAIDHRVDLYATGVLLYQLVAGRPPFVGSPEVLMYKVVNDLPPPPSSVAGGSTRFDDLALQALAKDPAQRFSGALAFRHALAQALGEAPPPLLSPELVQAETDPYAPTERIPTGMPTSVPTGTGFTGEPPAHFDAEQLAKAEAALAQHVGPLAKVMVRRTARQCHDLPELYARLAEQITQHGAREAFLGQASRSGITTAGTGGSTGLHTGTGGTRGSRLPTNTGFLPPTGMLAAPVSDAWLEQVQKLLTVRVGPIAKVMVKRAAERTRQREELVQQFAAAVPDAQRRQLLDEIDRLG